jgi:threonine synthase
MKYISSRNKNEVVSISKAITKGLASDGGLYTPEHFGKVDLEKISTYSFNELAKYLFEFYFTDSDLVSENFTKEEIASCVDKAYNTKNFETIDICPVDNFKNSSFHEIQLYKGPTCAFKDIALTILPHFMTTSYKKQNFNKPIYILVATSGDTGKAALSGFADVENTFISVFYPTEGVSKIQKLQMQTSIGANVDVIGIEGNFDDCQRAVKSAMSNIKSSNVSLSSANSINIGRLLPQMTYYFSSYFNLVHNNEIKLGDKVNFVVPTGNFGDILAGYFAKLMGLPVDKLVCASNKNNVLCDFLRTGKYNAKRELFKTTSPSMDILVSSNLERLLFIESGYDDKLVKSLMESLNNSGSFEISSSLLSKINETFIGYFAGEEECAATIKTTWEKDKKLIDTHTAIAVSCFNKFIQETSAKNKTIVLSTASAYKFASDVYKDITGACDADAFDAIKKLNELSNEDIPKGISNLASLPIRFTDVIDSSSIDNYINNKISSFN